MIMMIFSWIRFFNKIARILVTKKLKTYVLCLLERVKFETFQESYSFEKSLITLSIYPLKKQRYVTKLTQLIPWHDRNQCKIVLKEHCIVGIPGEDLQQKCNEAVKNK